MMYVIAGFAIWAVGWLLNVYLANGKSSDHWVTSIGIPLIFGITLLLMWECFVVGFEVNPVFLPRPSDIILRMTNEVSWLWADFNQTIIKGALTGYVIGGLAALAVAVLADRSEFLTRGVLPVGSFMAALPIVGIAPIFVKWFGSDWESKAAVVAVMVFFPILVNAVAGLRDTTSMQRDLMRTYGAGYWPTLFKLRVPAAMPFIFNGLKIATTLALIGAIVAEFFGSPTVGMGFRISTSFGQLALDMVWAEIVIAALAGSAFYGIVTLIEKGVTFWHPSQR
ncbi:MAG: ABC transporter permease [Tateyamaria sp.]|jgi:NitT/TauT family transport system permease protein|nr:ABC transporter permease [Tateyamaria sp.]